MIYMSENGDAKVKYWFAWVKSDMHKWDADLHK